MLAIINRLVPINIVCLEVFLNGIIWAMILVFDLPVLAAPSFVLGEREAEAAAAFARGRRETAGS